VTGCYEHGSEHSGSIIGREFLDCMSDYKLLKEDSAPWTYLLIYLGVEWIHLAQARDQWRASLNTVMNLWLP
jgi:hypothetical protein